MKRQNTFIKILTKMKITFTLTQACVKIGQ